MTNTNVVVLIGHLTRSMELTRINTGTAIGRLSIAVNRSIKRGEQWEEEVSFFDVTLWGKTAESLASYLVKGKQIAVTGYLKQERWQKDGQNYSRTVIVADNIELLGGTKKDSQTPPVPDNPPQFYPGNTAAYPTAESYTPPSDNNGTVF